MKQSLIKLPKQLIEKIVLEINKGNGFEVLKVQRYRKTDNLSYFAYYKNSFGAGVIRCIVKDNGHVDIKDNSVTYRDLKRLNELLKEELE